jgi:hypothetical protein
MGYAIAALLVILIIAAFVLFLVRNATAKSNVSDARDPGAEQNPLGIVGSDEETPAGDTNQHSESADEGRFGRETDRADVARPVVGGEAEGERSAR